MDPNSPSERDPSGNDNNILTIDDLQKLPVVEAESTSFAIENDKAEKTTESSSTTPESGMKESAAVTEVAEEAETQTLMTDQVKEKLLGVAAPVTAAAAAAGAAVIGFMSSRSDSGESERETSPAPGTSPDTPVIEKMEHATTAPIVDEVPKSDGEPVPGAVVPTTEKPETTEDTSEDKPDLETAALGADASAATESGFAEALAADKQANTASIVDEVPKSDGEPIPGTVVSATEKPETTENTSEDKPDLETAALGTDASAATESGFAEALAADKQANTAPIVDELPKPDGEPIPGTVVSATENTETKEHTSEDKPNLETVVLGTDTSAAAESGLAEALATDKQANTAPIVDDLPKSDGEPIPGTVFSATEKTEPTEDMPEDKSNLETAAPGPSALAAAESGFAEALAADKHANTAPTYIPISEQTIDAPPEKNESLGILPVPSETAPEGTKPLAKSTYKDPEKPADVVPLTAEPVQTEPVASSVPESATSEFQPVTGTSNIISSAETTTTTTSEELNPTGLASSEHAVETATKALDPESPTYPSLDVKETLPEFVSGAGVTSIDTAKDKESNDAGLSSLAADKADEEKVVVEADAKPAHIEPAVVDDSREPKPTVESLGTSVSPAVASTPVDASVPTNDATQEVTALGTEIVTDGGKESQDLKTELLSNGENTSREDGLAASQPPPTPEKTTTTTEKGPATPPKDSAPATPSKTPVSQSSAANNDKRVSGVPSESGSEKKKKKRGFLKKLMKAFS